MALRASPLPKANSFYSIGGRPSPWTSASSWQAHSRSHSSKLKQRLRGKAKPFHTTSCAPALARCKQIWPASQTRRTERWPAPRDGSAACLHRHVSGTFTTRSWLDPPSTAKETNKLREEERWTQKRKTLSRSSSCGGATRTQCHVAQRHVMAGRHPHIHWM